MRALGFDIRIALLLAAVLGVAAGCSPRSEPLDGIRPDPDYSGRFRSEFQAMGTDAVLAVCAQDPRSARRIIAPALERVRTVESLMSMFRPDSDIGRLNAAGAQHPVEVSPLTLRVLRASAHFSQLTGGAFDVTYTPLRSVWLKAQGAGALPPEEELRRALASVGFDKLVLSDGAAMFAREGMAVDLGGIAKGFAIDLAAEAMKGAGAQAALVDIGGDIRVVGRPGAGESWRILVRDPRGEGQPPIVLKLSDAAVATSGDYARYFSVGGRRFSHIIDPRTGRPVQDVPSATVVAPDATTADALATGISVLGAQKGLELIASLPGVECMIMARETGEGEAQGPTRLYYSKDFRTLVE
jgi:thiamine biosynthesis lipoprotein